MSNDRDLHLCHLIMQIRTWGFLTSGTWISSPISSMSKFSKSLIFIIHEIPSGISFWIPWIGGSQILELVVRLKQLPRQTKVGGPHNNFETMPHDVGPLGTKMTKTVNNPELSPLSSTFLWFHRWEFHAFMVQQLTCQVRSTGILRPQWRVARARKKSFLVRVLDTFILLALEAFS